MSEKDKEVIKNVAAAVAEMSDFEKGYILGVAETKLADKNKRETDSEREG